MKNELERREENVVKRVEELRAAMEAIQQPRSDFALRHFVVGTHDTPARCWAQAVLELQIKMFNIKRCLLDIAEKNIDLREAEDLAHERGAIKADRLRVDLAELELARLGAVREAECLLRIVEELQQEHGPFTYTRLQAEELHYWQRRLSRQALTEIRATGNVGQGNREAIRQMLSDPLVPGPSLLNGADLAAMAQLIAPEKKDGGDDRGTGSPT